MTSRLKQAEKLKLKTIENEPQKVQPPKIMTTVEKTKNILAAIQDKLIHDLDEHTIIIPNHKIPFQKPNENEKNEQQKQGWLKLQKVIQQKQQIKRKLNEVEKSQRLLQAGIDLTAIREKRIRPRSQLSTEDIEKLKKLKRQQKKFEQQLNIKTKLYQQSQRKHKQQQKILHEQQIKQTNEKKKQQIKKRLEELAERQKQRAAKFEEEKANYSKIRIQKRLHEQIAQKWEKSQKEVEQQKRKQLEQRKKQKSVDFSQLKQHEKKYEEIIQKNRQQMSKKRLQSSRTNNNFKSRIHQSKFYTLVVEEEVKKKKQENERKQIVVQLLERKKQFAEIVKRSYAPRVKQRSQENQEEEKKKSTIKKTVLDPQQFRRRGLSYLQEAKSKGNKSLKENQKSIEIEVETLSDNKTKYHDYLTEYRRNREKSDEKSVKYEKNFNRDVQEAKNIMKKTSFSQKQKIQRVKMLAQKIQFDPKTSKSSTLLKKIQAKIQILEALQ